MKKLILMVAAVVLQGVCGWAANPGIGPTNGVMGISTNGQRAEWKELVGAGTVSVAVSNRQITITGTGGGGGASNAVSDVYYDGALVGSGITNLLFVLGENYGAVSNNGGVTITLQTNAVAGGGGDTNANFIFYGATNAAWPNGLRLAVAGILTLSTNGTDLTLTATEVGTVTDAQLADGTNSVKNWASVAFQAASTNLLNVWSQITTNLDTTMFLRGDGTWAVPPGTGGASTNDFIPTEGGAGTNTTLRGVTTASGFTLDAGEIQADGLWLLGNEGGFFQWLDLFGEPWMELWRSNTAVVISKLTNGTLNVKTQAYVNLLSLTNGVWFPSSSASVRYWQGITNNSYLFNEFAGGVLPEWIFESTQYSSWRRHAMISSFGSGDGALTLYRNGGWVDASNYGQLRVWHAADGGYIGTSRAGSEGTNAMPLYFQTQGTNRVTIDPHGAIKLGSVSISTGGIMSGMAGISGSGTLSGFGNIDTAANLRILNKFQIRGPGGDGWAAFKGYSTTNLYLISFGEGDSFHVGISFTNQTFKFVHGADINGTNPVAVIDPINFTNRLNGTTTITNLNLTGINGSPPKSITNTWYSVNADRTATVTNEQVFIQGVLTSWKQNGTEL